MKYFEISPLCQLANIELLDCDKANQGIKYWVASKDFFVIPDPQKTLLSVYTVDKFKACISSDLHRFSMATYESLQMINLQDSSRNGCAWTIIRLYYATYFAVHAILRLFGFSCTYLTKEYAVIINEFIELNKDVSAKKISKGNFIFQFLNHNSTVEITSVEHSHNSTWEAFFKLLNLIRADVENINTITENKIKIYDVLDIVIKSISDERSRHNWLCNFRNEINYQHNNKAWLPYKTNFNKYSIPTLNSILNHSEYQSNFLNCDKIQSFFFRSEIILKFYFELLILAREKNGGCGKIFRNGFFKHLHQKD